VGLLRKEKAKSLEPQEKGIHQGLLQFHHSVSILAANVYVGERSHPGIKGEMAGGIVAKSDGNQCELASGTLLSAAAL
jgi:hypothetical protein